MPLTYDEFKTRADTVRARIDEACRLARRDPSSVQLLAVTKTHPAETVDFAARYGLPAVGENRVQEALEKKRLTSATVRWELIGHLQSNKARLAATHFDRVQSVDNEKLLVHLDRAAAETGRPLHLLLQINAGHDPAKFGADPPDAARLVESALAQKNLRLDGLMTIAPLSDDPAVAERTFANLRTIRDTLAARFHIPLHELSMGMSGDLAAAIAAGSTQIRVGSALFGTRS